jgi:hypothetical protein
LSNEPKFRHCWVMLLQLCVTLCASVLEGVIVTYLFTLVFFGTSLKFPAWAFFFCISIPYSYSLADLGTLVGIGVGGSVQALKFKTERGHIPDDMGPRKNVERVMIDTLD